MELLKVRVTVGCLDGAIPRTVPLGISGLFSSSLLQHTNIMMKWRKN